jgi:tetratricopeptide (TPR) repeat protein
MIVRDAIYDRMDPVERLALHAMAGDALEEIYGPDTGAHAAELAWHFHEAATLRGPGKAVDCSERAAEWATDRLAYEDAPAHYERAISALALAQDADAQRHCELTLSLGEAQMRSGHRSSAEETLREAAHLARRLGSPEHLGNVALALAPGFFSIEVGVYDPFLVALLEEALSWIDDEDSPLRARLLARLAMAVTWSGRADQRCDFSKRALAICTRSSEPEATAEIDALCALHGDLWKPTDCDNRYSVVRRITQLSPGVESALLNLSFEITGSLERGEMFAVDATISEFESLERRLRKPRSMWYVGLYRSMRSLMKGRFREAECLAVAFAELGQRAGDRNASQSFGAQFAIIRWEQGNADEILPGIELFSERYPSVVAWRAFSAFLNYETGRIEEALGLFEQLALSDFGASNWNETSVATLVCASEVCASLGDVARAKILYELMAPAESRFAVVGYGAVFLGSVDRSLGVLATCLGDQERANRHLESAIRQNVMVGALPWVARSEFDYSRSLLASKVSEERKRGDLILLGARQRARALGMSRLVDDIDATAHG